jgi:hypothetical protein
VHKKRGRKRPDAFLEELQKLEKHNDSILLPTVKCVEPISSFSIFFTGLILSSVSLLYYSSTHKNLLIYIYLIISLSIYLPISYLSISKRPANNLKAFSCLLPNFHSWPANSHACLSFCIF